MNELQQLFIIDGDDVSYRGIMRLHKTFEGHWFMEAAVDLSEESTASIKVFEWRNDRLPRLEKTDLYDYQKVLMHEIMESLRVGFLPDEKKCGFRIPVSMGDLVEYNEVLKRREEDAKEAAEKRIEDAKE